MDARDSEVILSAPPDPRGVECREYHMSHRLGQSNDQYEPTRVKQAGPTTFCRPSITTLNRRRTNSTYSRPLSTGEGHDLRDTQRAHRGTVEFRVRSGSDSALGQVRAVGEGNSDCEHWVHKAGPR